MKIAVLVKANARQNGIVKTGENQFSIRVTKPPVENKANKAVIEILSEYFKVPKSKIELKRGEKARQKVFEIYV